MCQRVRNPAQGTKQNKNPRSNSETSEATLKSEVTPVSDSKKIWFSKKVGTKNVLYKVTKTLFKNETKQNKTKDSQSDTCSEETR